MATLAAAAAPPFDLPWRHFASGLVVLPAALALAALAAPAILEAPRGPIALAVVHLLALGGIATIVMGAVIQMVPVVTGAPLRGVAALKAAHVLVLLGGLALAAGFGTRLHDLALAGGVAVGLGVALHVGAIAATLRGAARLDATGLGVAAATTCLAAGALVGVAALVNVRVGQAPALFGVAPSHAHVMMGGWITALTAIVSHKLLAMFLLVHGHPPLTGRLATAALAAGALAWLVALAWAPAWVAGAALQAVSATLYAADVPRLLRRRMKRRLDPGLGLAVAAIALLPALAMLGGATLRGMPGAVAAYGWLALGGWTTWTLLGYLYKIVPFVAWYHRFGAAPAGAPLAGDLVDPRLAGLAAVVLPAGTLTAAAGLLLAAPAVTTAGGLVAAAGAAVAAADLLAAPRRKGGPAWKPAPTTPA